MPCWNRCNSSVVIWHSGTRFGRNFRDALGYFLCACPYPWMALPARRRFLDGCGRGGRLISGDSPGLREEMQNVPCASPDAANGYGGIWSPDGGRVGAAAARHGCPVEACGSRAWSGYRGRGIGLAPPAKQAGKTIWREVSLSTCEVGLAGAAALHRARSLNRLRLSRLECLSQAWMRSDACGLRSASPGRVACPFRMFIFPLPGCTCTKTAFKSSPGRLSRLAA